MFTLTPVRFQATAVDVHHDRQSRCAVLRSPGFERQPTAT